MPTRNPRLTLTLDPSIAAQLRRMSELTGNSQASMVSEILQQSASVFDRMIHVLEAAELAQAAAKEEAAASLDRAQAKVEKQLGLVLDMFDEGTRPLLEHVEKVRRRKRPERAAGGAPGTGIPPARAGRATPPSNRGVRNDPKHTEKPAAMRLSGELKQESYKHARPIKKLDKTTVKKGAAA